MTISTPVIQARHVLGRASAGDYIDWAADALAVGADSRNLRILAGLDRFVSSLEAGEHFKKAIKELGLAAPNRDRALKDLAVHLAEPILEPDSKYPEIVAKLAELCSSNDDPDFLMDWYWLHQGLTDLRYGGYPYGYEALYQADPREVVADFARSFITWNVVETE